MSRGVDVLAVLREQIEASRNSMQHLPEVLHEKIEQAIEEVETVHAAVAELIAAAEETQSDAFILGMEIPRLVAAIARARGAE